MSPRFSKKLRLKTGQNGDNTEPAMTETRLDWDKTENKVDRNESKRRQRTGTGHNGDQIGTIMGQNQDFRTKTGQK